MDNLKQTNFATATADVTLVTTTEAVAVSSPLIPMAYDQGTVLVFAWAQVTTGTNTTGITPRIRRGTGITGTLVGEANAITDFTAGQNMDLHIMVSEFRATAGEVQYSLTIQQTAASANGTVLQSGIAVLVI